MENWRRGRTYLVQDLFAAVFLNGLDRDVVNGFLLAALEQELI